MVIEARGRRDEAVVHPIEAFRGPDGKPAQPASLRIADALLQDLPRAVLAVSQLIDTEPGDAAQPVEEIQRPKQNCGAASLQQKCCGNWLR
jgi:hypothetical protein